MKRGQDIMGRDQIENEVSLAVSCLEVCSRSSSSFRWEATPQTINCCLFALHFSDCAITWGCYCKEEKARLNN